MFRLSKPSVTGHGVNRIIDVAPIVTAIDGIVHAVRARVRQRHNGGATPGSTTRTNLYDFPLVSINMYPACTLLFSVS